MLKVSEVAKMCQVHPKTIRRAIARGELRAARLGIAGALRLREVDVDDWLAARALPARDAGRRPTPQRGILVP